MADLKKIFKFEIGLKKISKKPAKRRMNLADDGKRHNRKVIVAVTAAVLLIVFGLVLKFGVLDLYSELSELELRKAELQEQVTYKNDLVNSMDSMDEDYAHYVYPDYSKEELARVDRNDVLDLIERYIEKKEEIVGWSLYDNELTIELSNSTFNKANIIVENMQVESIVDYGFVSNAKGKSENEKPGDDVVIRDGDKIEDVGASHENKTVVITVYLKVPDDEMSASSMPSLAPLPTQKPTSTAAAPTSPTGSSASATPVAAASTGTKAASDKDSGSSCSRLLDGNPIKKTMDYMFSVLKGGNK